MNFDLRPLFHPSYWLTLDVPNVASGAGPSLLVLFAGMIVASIVLRRVKVPQAADRHQANVYRRVAGMLVTMGILGLVLYFLSYEEVRALGARPLYLVWILGLAAWIVSIVRRAKREIPAAREREEQRNAKSKYLPGRRK